MPSLKDVKTQIVGVKKTKQITKAMNMVASSKLRGAQQRIEHFRPYADKYGQLLHEVALRAGETAHPLLEVREEKKTIVIVLMTSDRGLCGSYNINIINAAMNFAKEQTKAGVKVQFIAVGKKSREAIVKAGYDILESFVDVFGDINFSLATYIGDMLISMYENKEIDEVFIVYGLFVHVAKQVPESMLLLPVMPIGDTAKDHASETEYVYEPDEKTLLTELLPKYVNCQLYRGLLDSSASENAARMTAMDNATRNCDDMIKSLTLLYNKTRQATITAELVDIVGGVEALNG